MTEMNLHNMFDTLDRIYRLFDSATAPFTVACKKQCAHCCTCNVTATGLEVAYIFHRLDKDACQKMIKRLETVAANERYRPKSTTNGFARVCMEGRDTAQEENNPAWGSCPLLENGICTIYPVRPLGCRVMMSETPCEQTGTADMPELALTITTVFMQFVEHLDEGGVYGSFLDLLEACQNDGVSQDQGPGGYIRADLPGMVKNEKIPVLMIPPEHRSSLSPIVQALGTMMAENG